MGEVPTRSLQTRWWLSLHGREESVPAWDTLAEQWVQAGDVAQLVECLPGLNLSTT